jgi:hypothetical protein
MQERNMRSADEELDFAVNWIDGRIALLNEYLQEGLLESVCENLLDSENPKTKKEILKANLSKYIEVTSEIELCNTLKKKMLKDYNDDLFAEAKFMAQDELFASRESLRYPELETIPDPRLWEE